MPNISAQTPARTMRAAASRRNVRLFHALASIAIVAGMLGASTIEAEAYVCKTFPEQADAYLATKGKATMRARRNWSSKVKSQYGLAWAAWNIAENKTVDCKIVDGKWSCEAKARPCQYVAP